MSEPSPVPATKLTRATGHRIKYLLVIIVLARPANNGHKHSQTHTGNNVLVSLERRKEKQS